MIIFSPGSCLHEPRQRRTQTRTLQIINTLYLVLKGSPAAKEKSGLLCLSSKLVAALLFRIKRYIDFNNFYFMKNKSVSVCLGVALLAISFAACKKNGMNSAMAKKIQYRWETISFSVATDYLDGRSLVWTTQQVSPGNNYTQFDNDAVMYQTSLSYTAKYYYKVDDDKILYLVAASTRPTTPQYTDTSFIRYVDDNLLVLYSRRFFSSGSYGYINQRIDSLKK